MMVMTVVIVTVVVVAVAVRNISCACCRRDRTSETAGPLQRAVVRSQGGTDNRRAVGHAQHRDG